MSSRRYWLLFLIIVVFTFSLRLFFIERTAWEWDEPLYTNISSSVLEIGYPSFETNTGDNRFFSYHPPFHYYLLASWYQLVGETSVDAGRVLSSLMGTLLVAAAMVATKNVSQSRSTALLVGALLSFDGWFTYTSMIVKLDVTAALVGTIGIIILIHALRKDNVALFLFAGLVLGFGAIYKHVGIAALAAVPLLWVLYRQRTWEFLIVGITGGMTIILYFLVMGLTLGTPFIAASTVQIRRALGLQQARGLHFGLEEILQALVQTYWAYTGTLLLLAFGGLVALIWTVRHLQHNGYSRGRMLVASWALASLVLLAAVRLRNPHYLPYAIIPTAIVGMSQVRLWWGTGGNWRKLAVVVTVAIMLLNFGSLVIRLTQFSGANALESTGLFIQEQLLSDAVLLSEETVCAMAVQPCFRFDTSSSAEQLWRRRPEFVIVYTTITQNPPDTPAINQVLAASSPVFSVTDWKGTIVVLAVPPEFWEEEKPPNE